MASYCTNCGNKLDVGARFCGHCGKPCAKAADGRSRSYETPAREGRSGGWKFLAGTAVGAFLANLFGGSTASAHTSDVMEKKETLYEQDAVGGDESFEEDDDDAAYMPADDTDWEETDSFDDGGDGYDSDDGYDSYDDDGEGDD